MAVRLAVHVRMRLRIRSRDVNGIELVPLFALPIGFRGHARDRITVRGRQEVVLTRREPAATFDRIAIRIERRDGLRVLECFLVLIAVPQQAVDDRGRGEIKEC